MTTINDNVMVPVRNMTNQLVLYVIEEDNVRRRFSGHETKNISAKELRKLMYIDGGDVLLREYLCVQNKDLAKEFGIPDDMIEYYWTKEDIDKLLLEGSIEALQDAIEFGPAGISDLIKSRAIELDLNDLAKRKVINDMLNIDLDSMSEIYKEERGEQPEEASHRRVSQEEKKPESGRRVQN